MPLRMWQVGWDEKWIEGRNGRVVGEHIFVPSVCKWIKEDNTCELKDKKPDWCKAFPENVGNQDWLRAMGCRYFKED